MPSCIMPTLMPQSLCISSTEWKAVCDGCTACTGFSFLISFPSPLCFTALIGACGGNYTSATAVIYSPDFPDTYGTGKVCYWTIQVPGASQILFSFVLFEIKDATDMVELLDGYTYHVLARFNGKNRPPHTFNISLDFVILYFFSDEINQAQGFAIRYRGKRLALFFVHFSVSLKHVIHPKTPVSCASSTATFASSKSQSYMHLPINTDWEIKKLEKKTPKQHNNNNNSK